MQDVEPALPSGRFRFAVEEVDVELADEEGIIRDRVHARAVIVVRDVDGGRRNRAHLRADEIRQRDGENFGPFDVDVVDDGNEDRLGRFTGGKPQRAYTDGVVAALRSVAGDLRTV